MNYSRHELRQMEDMIKPRRLTIKERVMSAVSILLLVAVIYGVAAFFHKGTP